MHWNEIFNLLRCKVEWVLEAVSGFTNPFSSSFEGNELYFLSFRVSASKRGIAKDLIEADDIGRKAVADFIDSLLVKKNLSFASPIKCCKLHVKSFDACEVKQEEIAQFTKRKQPDKSLKERLW